MLYVPFSQAGYVLGTSLVIDPAQYVGGGPITISLNGATLLPSHTGWCLDVKSNYFGANNGAVLGKKQVSIVGGGGIITGTATAAGGVRLTETVGSIIRDLTCNGYTAGSAFQLYIASTDLSTWVEHSELVNLRGAGNLNGVYLKINGNLTSSFLGNVFRNIVFEAKVNNGKLFNIEGTLFDCLFEQCGGYYNQNSTTGGSGFYLNGGFTGSTFVNPWIDKGNTGTQSAATDIVFGPNYTAALSYQPTIINPLEINLPTGWRTKLLVPGPIGFGTASTSAAANPREVLRSPRTYFVSTTGSDSTGDGLTSGTAFATVAQAASVIYQTLDLASQTVTIQLADGTYSQVSLAGVPLGLGTASLILSGNTGTPGNVVISTTSQDALVLTNGARLTIQGIKLQTATSGNGISLDGGSALAVGSGNQFGACATRGVQCVGGSSYTIGSSYTLAGDMPTHVNVAGAGSRVVHNSGAIDATGRAFSGHFVECHENASYSKNGGSYVTTSSTGGRYFVYTGGVIQTFGGGASLFPGANAGVADAATFGVYA